MLGSTRNARAGRIYAYKIELKEIELTEHLNRAVNEGGRLACEVLPLQFALTCKKSLTS